MGAFADLLNSAMDEAGLSAAEVAEGAGLTESAISLLRAGRREPSYRTLQRLAQLFPSLGEQLAESDGPFDSIEAAIADIRAGKMVVVLDDEDRENEGDLVMAAQMVAPEAINFMRKHAGGLVCVPMLGSRLDELHIPQMVRENTAVHETAFTVSVEARGVTTTGISAHDRAATISRLLDHDARAADFLRPGHTFPLRAREGGVLVRAGQTEAAVDLARLAGLYPAGVICEIMADDGSMERLEGLRAYADRHSLKLITVKDLIAYRMRTEKLVKRIAEFELPTTIGKWQGIAYTTSIDENTHVALVMGDIGSGKELLVRVHSECMTGDALHSVRCDCAAQRDGAMKIIAREGRGVFLYLRQEGRGIGLADKLRAYELQDRGADTVEANVALGLPIDKRDYGIGSQILADLGVREMRLITNNPRKIFGLEGYGLKIVGRVSLQTTPTAHNKHYIDTKRAKLGHMLDEVSAS
ncbi:MAG TPA: bifunctional 3,4-dihydroxy-2-butanone-4-phosphate synthase/GTP cyclohydrolase II [Candidatus Cybelea sp.]|jgi:3,4-dihydroxy 2-butanone 4-phosphate synthase/GTP cyclohydrolase II|nr:bifunctional 3,4-dihydroxy-2-butanone-4-phosphate synthase/GTP cyclohydrolase II [Candidatus Cybelea sp.]